MKKLDNLDKNILDCLEDSENISPEVSKIAEKLEKPITTIYSRIKRLEKKGVLKGFKPIIDKGNRNITSFMLLEAKPGTDPDTLGEALSKIPMVEEVHFVTGDWYFLLKFKVNNMEDYYRISGETLVRDYKELTKVVGILAPKTYKE